MKGMTTCKVCGRDFPLLAEEHYIARNPDREGGQIGVIIAGKDEPAIFDAFDCPHCGCQNVMQERKFVFEATVFTECENEDEEEEEN